MKPLLILIPFVYGLGWLVSVGSVVVIQWLANATFNTQFDINIWVGGLLFYICWLLLR